ncbi:unnamed protein product [Rhizophagus irregularis]|nr:unnamed protein product [Rhizophagus irregularis]CAB5369980.1 unnamed protein product [Rhizophagus irregularis]
MEKVNSYNKNYIENKNNNLSKVYPEKKKGAAGTTDWLSNKETERFEVNGYFLKWLREYVENMYCMVTKRIDVR